MSDTAQYVVSCPYKQGGESPKRSVASFVDQLSGVRILSEVDHSMVLVEMSSVARDQLQQAHPEFAVEPNIVYKR